MIQSQAGWRAGYRKLVIYAAIAMLVAGLTVVTSGRTASAAACATPPTDNGTVTQTVNVTEAGTYTVWTRMAAPNSSSNTYWLEIGGSECFEVGGSDVPVYSGSSAPYFVSGTSNWISETASGDPVRLALTAGNHQIKLIGAHADVVVDRLLLTQDAVCTPTGVGDNCATEYLMVDINEDGEVDYLDLSSVSNSYEQTGSGAGRNDINRDGIVNYIDLSLLGGHFGS